MQQDWYEKLETWRSELPGGGKGDRLIRFFIFSRILLESGKNGRKRAEKEYRSLREDNVLDEALHSEDPEAQNALSALCLDSARRYLQTSLSDPSYSSKFFHLLRMQRHEVLEKMRTELEGKLDPFLSGLPADPLQKSLLQALREAFREIEAEPAGMNR